MKEKMKVMIAYDGSAHADAALNDLTCAGLPENGKALIVSVVDLARTAIPSSSDINTLGTFVAPRLLTTTIALAEREAQQAHDEAQRTAIQASAKFVASMSGWRAAHHVFFGNPSEVLLQTAGKWRPDLLALGSHGRGALGRFFLGSVSKKIAEEAGCSVRVARYANERNALEPPRILVNVNNSIASDRTLQHVIKRQWKAGTKVKLVSIDDGVSVRRISAVLPYAERMFEWAAEALENAGLEVSSEVRKGNPKIVLLEEARQWRADMIFAAARGMYEFQADSPLDKTAAALVTEANCPVEIVR